MLTFSRGVVGLPIRRDARSLYWWSRPSRLVAFVLIPIYLYCGYMDEAFYALYGHQGKYLVGDTFVVGLAALGAFALGSACVEDGIGPAPARSWVSGARVRKALLALYVVVLIAYAFFLFPILLRPQLLLEHLSGSVETMVELRNVLNRVPGFTSLVALQSLCVVLTLNYGRLTGERLPRHYLVLMAMVVVACALRAWLWSERLALIEVIVPAAIVKFADPQGSRDSIASRLLILAPIAGLGVAFVLFSFGEYFRSWQYYKDYLPYTFLEFSWNRFMGYYATALQNGGLLYALFETEYRPVTTAFWLYKLPIWEILNVPVVPESNHREFLRVYLNPEFNNMSGVFMPLRDFGTGLGMVYWVLLGVLSGVLYRSLATGQLLGLVLYPAWFVGVAEILRLFYWGEPRFFPIAVIGPILVYYLGASVRIARRRVFQGGVAAALLGLCLTGGATAARAEVGVGRTECAPMDAGALARAANVRAFGARGDGQRDDGPAIQKAVDSLAPGGVLLFPEGTYSHSDVIRVRRDGVVLVGRQAVLLASNLNRAAIIVEASGTVLRDLVIRSVATDRRGERAEHAGMLITGPRVTAINNVVDGFIGAGIFVNGARDFSLACNRVSNTKADGIHITSSAANGRVIGNSVYNSEDDGIGVVAYGLRERASGILVEGNRVEHIPWGRGISVVGATGITIRRNVVLTIAAAAGILVAREAAYGTPGPSDVVIEANEISDIQRSLAPLGNGHRTGHGAIDINSDSSEPSLSVRDVIIVGNSIKGAAHYGIRLLGNVCDVAIESNAIADVPGPGIAVVQATCAKTLSGCRDNRREGQPAGCDGRF